MERSQRMNVTKGKAETPAKNAIMEKSPPKEGSVMSLVPVVPEKECLKIRNIREATFWLPKSATDDGDRVYLVGDFNNWNIQANPMKKQKNGNYTTTIELDPAKEYGFGYIRFRETPIYKEQ